MVLVATVISEVLAALQFGADKVGDLKVPLEPNLLWLQYLSCRTEIGEFRSGSTYNKVKPAVQIAF